MTNVNKNKSEVIIKGIQAEFQLAEINLFRNLSFTCPFIILGLRSEEFKNLGKQYLTELREMRSSCFSFLSLSSLFFLKEAAQRERIKVFGRTTSSLRVMRPLVMKIMKKLDEDPIECDDEDPTERDDENDGE